MKKKQFEAARRVAGKFCLLSAAALLCAPAVAQKKVKFDWSLAFVPEEGGVRFEKITEDADNVASYNGNIVSKGSGIFGSKKMSTLDWWVIPQIAVSPDGKRIGYINEKNKMNNIMIKDARKGGASVQRTFRTNIQGFSWSPDGTQLCFTELRGGHFGVYLIDAVQGSVVRQISSGNENDMGGVVSADGNTIFFHRGEGLSSYSLWSYDRTNNLFSNYSRGMTVCLIPGEEHTVYCARFTDRKESEIWRVNFQTGVEELILAVPDKSFTSPQLSPDGRWLLLTGSSVSEGDNTANTDIFVVRTDGTQFTQLTYHPGNDLSSVWSPDGKSIYFLSQRGSSLRKYNVWRMDFNL
ncbi:MAG: PD40 domain-containing protein [Prevotellaceae bacterium]|nr:PD40 domain-containing protein [Prevotellaceae bacterium]